MPLDGRTFERLERGAAAAREDFRAHYQRWTSAEDVARWMKKWCREVVSGERTLDGTNYDRLGKILIEETGVKRRPGDLPGDAWVKYIR